MKKGYTHVAIVLDRSGSMQSVKSDMVSGLNNFIDGLKKQDGECQVSAAQFDTGSGYRGADWYEYLFDLPLSEVKPLTDDKYVPRGGTPLTDAIGRTIDELGARFDAMSEDKRPEHVIVLIITDGEENSSKLYSQAQVREMVAHQSDVYKWAFTFLGSNQDAVLQAQEYNIPARQTMSFSNTQRGYYNTSVSAALFSNCVRMGTAAGVAGAASYTADARMAAVEDVDLDIALKNVRDAAKSGTAVVVPVTTTTGNQGE